MYRRLSTTRLGDGPRPPARRRPAMRFGSYATTPQLLSIKLAELQRRRAYNTIIRPLRRRRNRPPGLVIIDPSYLVPKHSQPPILSQLLHHKGVQRPHGYIPSIRAAGRRMTGKCCPKTQNPNKFPGTFGWPNKFENPNLFRLRNLTIYAGGFKLAGISIGQTQNNE